MSTIVLPRYLHKRGVESLLVKDADAYEAAIADGWSVSNWFPDEAPAEPAPEAEAVPVRRGRKPKAD